MKITPISEVQKQTEAGYKYTIEGVVTSNASGYDKDTAFFDCIYVQDSTGGINCFPVAGNFKIGDRVRVSGTTDFYQGELELQVTSITKIVEGEPVVPTEVTAAQVNDGSVLGSLITLRGFVESFELENGLVQTIMVRDKDGNVARVFIDGYITTAEDVKKDSALTGPAKLVKMVQDILDPVDRMDGDSLPVSAFVDHVDGTFELGAAAYEKRGVAVMVPTWDATKCIQCNQCSFVCPHATIRPFMLTEEEAAAAPEAAKIVDVKAGKGKGVYKFAMAISPLDCMGCTVCAGVCPTKALTMVPQEQEAAQQEVFNYMVEKVSAKADVTDLTVKGSQFKKPLLEFSGSCAGCAETSYARLITQLFGDRMYISNATGCSSIWGGPAATSPYTTTAEGKGPAWANSLFEDNAEHGLGMYLGQKAIRERLITKLEAMAAAEATPAEAKAAIQAFLDTKDDGAANGEATKALVAELEKGAAAGCEDCKYVLAEKEYLNKKSVWIFGGDGWAYDIGFGGVDHVLASGEDVNVFVFDTEVYSNTGGQASKSSNIGQVAQFAAAGKTVAKKSLAEIAMTYGYVYVAQIAMGANMNQTLKAIAEAEAYHGPSLIIGYAPCEMHSIKGGMANCQAEMKKAVECGYWNLFRFNPALKAEGKNPFTLDSKAPAGGYQEFLMNEARYSSLTRSFPDRAKELFALNEETAKARYEKLIRMQKMYEV